MWDVGNSEIDVTDGVVQQFEDVRRPPPVHALKGRSLAIETNRCPNRQGPRCDRN